MRAWRACLCGAALLSGLTALSARAEEAPPVASATRCAQPPSIDGVLDDPCWAQASFNSDFTQRYPNDGAPPSYPTEFAVAYDDAALYVAIRAYDDPELITAPLARRDGSMTSDAVNVGIGSLADRRTAFDFAANPRGVKTDGRNTNDTDYDAAWDPVWDLGTQIDAQGWIAEMAIPLGQLRFQSDSAGAWDLQVGRYIARLSEKPRWSYSPRDAAGYVSRFGTLRGLEGLAAQSTLSVVPYLRGSVRAADANDDNPFESSASWDATLGVDLSAPLGSAFTLGLTANPDFGQVEGDPARLNLSAFETYLDERRPFFLEGSNYFAFGGPELFYSRRLGRPPRGSVDTEGWVDTPTESPIFLAARLTGSSAEWTLGVLDAITDEVVAEVRDADGTTRQVPVEPLANTLVARVQRSLRNGATTLGGVLTTLHRDELESALLPTQAYALGIDWKHRWDDLRWAFSGFVASSLVVGSVPAMRELQSSSAHYFQRPDASHLGVDWTRVMAGGAAAVALDREGGEHWLGGIKAETTTPGFEVNDVGFNSRADILRGSAWLKYRELEGGSWWREWDLNTTASTKWNYGGEHARTYASLEGYMGFANEWAAWLGVDGESPGRCFDCTWGGPSMYYPAATSAWFGGNSDSRNDWRLQLNTWVWSQPEANTWGWGANGTLRYRPLSSLEMSLSPSYTRMSDDWSWVDASAAHPIFAALEQHTLSTALRLDWTFTPELSLQGWVQFFASVGSYSDFRAVVHPEAEAYDAMFAPLAALNRGDGGLVLSDGTDDLILADEPDFESLALRSTVVLRWEWAPGSTAFLVWQQRRAGGEAERGFALDKDLAGLFDARSETEHIVMVKLSAWFGE